MPRILPKWGVRGVMVRRNPDRSVHTREAALLAKLDLATDQDLVLHLPLRYEDETSLTPANAAPVGREVLVEARVESFEVAYRPRRQLIVHTRSGGHPLALRFFSFYPSQLKQFQRATDEQTLLRAYGEVRTGWFGAEIAHPRYRMVKEGEALASSLTPVYSSTAGLSQTALRRRILAALASVSMEDTLPDALLGRLGLMDYAESIRLLHQPSPGADMHTLVGRTHPAWRRIKFDELLAQQLSMRMAYNARRSRQAPVLESGGPRTTAFMHRLPFALTGAQGRALAEIQADLARRYPMQRLLQGDVGSGKTIIAAISCLAAVDAGFQAVVMAPTEILAEQHLRKFSDWLCPLGVPVVWLHGGLGVREKRAALHAIASGEGAIAIGTHALFQRGVEFNRLALAVVDEQHRFGVEQRLTLKRKAEQSADSQPHQLMMSATPIPRTLAMSYYADLDVSVIDELPPGRQAVATRLVADSRRGEVLLRVRAACADGEQAYWVCPVIEESREGELQTAIDTHRALVEEFDGLRIGLLHGRLPGAEKAAVMSAFAAGEIHVLVATTVIEVGVDVPNASLMVIEHAERFGLSQLHQLRGRVGRGRRRSSCILLYGSPLSANGRARLKIIYENSDGFEIARQDLQLRGPGEVLGERQSGVPLLRFADLELDQDLLDLARATATDLLAEDPVRARRHVDRWLGRRRDFADA
jgi:ATP-dependent DNA helicase RecG